MIIALDFDGTLVGHTFPEIGEPRMWLIERAIQWRKDGDKLILWTCREDVTTSDYAHYVPRNYLTEAVEYCKSLGLEFDAVNQQLDEIDDPMLKVGRKIFADIYIDDRSAIFNDTEELILNMNDVNDVLKQVEKP